MNCICGGKNPTCFKCSGKGFYNLNNKKQKLRQKLRKFFMPNPNSVTPASLEEQKIMRERFMQRPNFVSGRRQHPQSTDGDSTEEV